MEHPHNFVILKAKGFQLPSWPCHFFAWPIYPHSLWPICLWEIEYKSLYGMGFKSAC